MTRRDPWLVPDVWTTAVSQGSMAIYPEDIKWPNGHIICTELSWRNLYVLGKVLRLSHCSALVFTSLRCNLLCCEKCIYYAFKQTSQWAGYFFFTRILIKSLRLTCICKKADVIFFLSSGCNIGLRSVWVKICAALTLASLGSLFLFPQQELANFLNLIYHLVDTEGNIWEREGDLREFSTLKKLNECSNLWVNAF